MGSLRRSGLASHGCPRPLDTQGRALEELPGSSWGRGWVRHLLPAPTPVPRPQDELPCQCCFQSEAALGGDPPARCLPAPPLRPRLLSHPKATATRVHLPSSGPRAEVQSDVRGAAEASGLTATSACSAPTHGSQRPDVHVLILIKS